ncbi:MAG TPA: hypothetical protein PKN32_12505 [Bacteroidales bacterium]|nr:hypothetical protein [Bacteroidales bacterium]
MKNHTYLFLILGVLFVGFGIFSLLVYLTKGKNNYFLRKKLAIGASVISLTFAANGCKPVVTCYVRAIDPMISSQDSVNHDQQIVLLKSNNKLSFNYTTYNYNYLKYSLDNDNQTISSGDCVLQSQEGYNYLLLIEFPHVLETGMYKLVIYYFDEKITDKNKDLVFSKNYNIKVVE